MDDRDAVEIDRLLDDLCTHLGICLPHATRQRLRDSAPRDVAAFADAVLVAEGLDPSLHKDIRRKTREHVSRAMTNWT